jgi:hypothetical protein
VYRDEFAGDPAATVLVDQRHDKHRWEGSSTLLTQRASVDARSRKAQINSKTHAVATPIIDLGSTRGRAAGRSDATSAPKNWLLNTITNSCGRQRAAE